MNHHKFKKKWGQNFLKTKRFIDYLITPLELSEEDLVIEIGPGDGAVTAKLLETGAYVISIDIDYDVMPRLVKKYGEFPNFKPVNEDILLINLAKLIETFPEKQSIKITGSLPYNISKPIIRKCLQFAKAEKRLKIMTFIVQDEVAKAMTAKAPNASLLSNELGLIGEFKKLKSIPASHFLPKPKVDGGIIQIKIKPNPASSDNLMKLMKIGFISPRKTLYNNLKNSRKFDKIDIAMSSLGFKSTVRASELTLENWQKLSASLKLVVRKSQF